MAKWSIEKKLSRRQGEKDYLLGHCYLLLLALRNSTCLVLLIPKARLDLNAHLSCLTHSLSVSRSYSLLFLFRFRR